MKPAPSLYPTVMWEELVRWEAFYPQKVRCLIGNALPSLTFHVVAGANLMPPCRGLWLPPMPEELPA